MTRYGYDRLLIILLASNPLIEPHYVVAGEMLLMNHHQIVGFDKGPLQIMVDISTDLS